MTLSSFEHVPPGLRLAGAATLLLALLTGCGARTSVMGEWQEPRATAIPFDNVLVVGISPTSKSRRSFEQALVPLIAAGGTKALASIVLGGSKQPLTPEHVQQMVRDTGADAVLITRIVSRRVKLEESAERVGVKTRQPSSLKDVPGVVDLFRTDYQEYEEPGELTARAKATLASSLYAAADGERLVYTIETTVKFDEEKDDPIAAVTEAIARQLRREGLIR
jgi:hypothetical protein